MSYAQYHQWLFPGDPVIEQNPLDVDASTSEILAEVSQQTGISVGWLQESTREVLEGLAGLGCLWFLHGASGQAQGKETTPAWLNALLTFACRLIRSSPKEQQLGITSFLLTGANWQRGNFTVRKGYANRKPAEQTFKLGKFIDKYAEFEGLNKRQRLSMHHDLKWRAKTDMFDWWVSCHPYDVLTMSYGRPWPSCMKPGGLFEYGPLTDMAAGSAIVWFKPVGSDAPSGRIILRPYLERDGTPAIATGGRAYGRCPPTGVKDLEKLLKTSLGEVKINRIRICPLGQDARALTRAIYSDTDNVAGGCEQSVDEYEDAYATLGKASWLPAEFVINDLAEAAKKQAVDFWYRISTTASEDTNEYVYTQYVVNSAEHALLTEGFANILEFYLQHEPSNATIYDLTNDEVGSCRVAQNWIEEELCSDDPAYRPFTEGGVEPDSSIRGDIAHELRREALKELKDRSENLTLTTFGVGKTPSDFLLPELVFEFTPDELYKMQPMLFEYNAELSWDEQGRAIDEETGEEVETIIIVPEWYTDETYEIEQPALHRPFRLEGADIPVELTSMVLAAFGET